MLSKTTPVRTSCVLRDGQVIPPTGLEIIVADHCNIACRQCNHASPVMRKWNATAEDVGRDLALLAGHYRPAFLKYIGGEPLLHPDLPGLLRACRASGIANHHLLVTNGTLLAHMSPEIWGLINEIEISFYPETDLTNDRLVPYRRAAAEHGVKITVNHFPMFRRTFTRQQNEDTALIGQIFRACKLANVWGCHTLYRGAIYRCPQSAYALGLAGAEGFDGLKLEEQPDLAARLLAFLNSPEPLASCRYCVGTSGRKQPHRLLPRADWASDLNETAQDMLDPVLLAQNLHEIITLDDCNIPDNHVRRSLVKRMVHYLGIRSTRMRRTRFRRNAPPPDPGIGFR